MIARRFFLFALGLALSLQVAGCATRVEPPAIFAASLEAPYTLASGDKLRVIVFGQDNLSNIYPVDGGGHIAMPLIGAVGVAGLGTQQVVAAVEQKLRVGYVREPKVTVEVDAYRPFFILGEVTNAGQFPFVNGMTVQTAVAIASGFSPRAAQSYAEITRLVRGQPTTARVPVDFPVRPGDTIVIKERWF